MKIYKSIISVILMASLFLMLMPSVFALPPPPLDDDGNPYPYTPLDEIEIAPSDGSGKYEEFFIEYLNSQYENESYQYYYNELFAYSANENTSTPDFVLVECYKDYVGYERDFRVFVGDYVFISDYDHYPYNLGYFVFTPANNQILTIEEAIISIPNVGEALFDNGVCRMLGDVNIDGELNIKDATAIQKKIANIIELDDEYTYIVSDVETKGLYSDFNRDEILNVKDATAIQKNIAGLAY